MPTEAQTRALFQLYFIPNPHSSLHPLSSHLILFFYPILLIHRPFSLILAIQDSNLSNIRALFQLYLISKSIHPLSSHSFPLHPTLLMALSELYSNYTLSPFIRSLHGPSFISIIIDPYSLFIHPYSLHFILSSYLS